jgi:hypothetical protein
VKITPEEASPLQGYDPNVHIAAPQTDILDDIYARVLVLDDGTQRKVIVSVDCCLTNEVTFQASDPGGNSLLYRHLLQTFPMGTRRLWGDAAGTQETAVSVHATHTHSAPEHFPAKYTSRIEDAIREAASEMQAVRLRTAAGNTALAVNRRPSLQHNEDLPIDNSLNVIVFENEDGQPLGGIVNCAIHPTLLLNPINRVSAEFVGLAMKEWEQEKHNGFVALFVQGFSGDVGPYGHYRNEIEDTYPLVKQRGHELYQEIAAVAERTQSIRSLPLASMEKQVDLPTKAGYFKPSIGVTLHGMRIGDMLIVSVSCEVFSGYIGMIKPSSPVSYTLFAGVSNGYCGYLPTPQAYQDGLGGYEMNTTPYTPEACHLFTQAALQLLDGLS